MSKKEKKTIKIDKRLFIVIIIILILILGVGGYFLYQYFEFKKPLKEEWGQKYYVYLKNIKENKKNKEAGLPEKLKDSKIGFYKVNDIKDPIMVIEYEKNNETFSNVYYLKDNAVNNIVYTEPTEIEFLYNIETKKYNYYAHTENDGNDNYSSVSDKINAKEEKTYNFEKDEKNSVTSVDGEEISIDKKDEVFVETNTKETKEKWDTYLKEQELKDIMKRLVKKCTPQEEIEKEVEKEVNKEVEKVEKKQEEIKNAQAEVDKKEAEEEAKRKAEEEARGLKVDGHTLKYGTYKLELDEPMTNNGFSRDEEVFTLRSDGTCHHKATDKIRPETFDRECTYKVTLIQNSLSPLYEGLKIYDENGKVYTAFSVGRDNFISDQYHGLRYVG